jgi:hypothetical protein
MSDMENGNVYTTRQEAQRNLPGIDARCADLKNQRDGGDMTAMTPKYKISVTHFRLHPELLDELLKHLDGHIYGSYSGLPLHVDNELESMREAVCGWLEKYGKHITLRNV